ncbi:MAG: tyrosine-type recombinase/integrase [Bacteroidota bacterium]
MKQTTFLKYLEFEKRFSPHTLTAYRSDLDQFLSYLNTTYELSEAAQIKHFHIRSWMVRLIEEQISPRSINRKLSTLKTYFRFLLRRGEISQNPMAKVLPPKVGKRLPVFVHQERMELLFERVEFSDDFAGVRDRSMLEVLYATGMRRSELIGLCINDIDFSKAYLKVLGKGNKERLIPFSPALGRILQTYLDQRTEAFPDLETDRVFLTDKGKPLYPKLVYNLVRKYLSYITTVEQKSPHVLRHSFATHLSDNGADLNAIKALLGHANLAATQIYTHNSVEKLKRVYDQAHPKARRNDK